MRKCALKMVQLAREGGATVVLDCGGAEGDISGDLLQLLTVLSPNETELARLTGTLAHHDARGHTQPRPSAHVESLLLRSGKGRLMWLCVDDPEAEPCEAPVPANCA